MPAGWPGTIKRMVGEVAQQVHAPLESIGYMDGLFSEREDEFRSLFSGRALRAFHCTRLLPHEEDWIRNRGLLLFTEQLVTERIERAVGVGAVTRQTADELLRSHVFATREHDNREKQVCFFLSPAYSTIALGPCGASCATGGVRQCRCQASPWPIEYSWKP